MCGGFEWLAVMQEAREGATRRVKANINFMNKIIIAIQRILEHK